MHDYPGGIHFHSSHSYDARIPLSKIIEAGQRAGLRYAILTDHFRLDARDEGLEGYHRDLLLIVGEEISPRYNHYLALNIRKPVVVWKTHLDAQHVIDAVNEQGGFGFIAHPDHEGAPLVGSRSFPWIAWNATGYAGLGIWDLISDWTSSLSSRWKIFTSCLRPADALRGPKPVTLARWDALTQKGHCVAIGEIDNHGHTRSYLGFLRRQIFPFEFAFRTIRTHVLLDQPLTGDAGKDQSAILDALKTGQSYVSLDLWRDPTGFHFEIFDDQHRATLGGDFERRGPALLEIKVPSGGGHIRVIRNGKVIYEDRSRSHIERDLELPGVYRVEVDQHIRGRWRPWIFSNPIWVR